MLNQSLFVMEVERESKFEVFSSLQAFTSDFTESKSAFISLYKSFIVFGPVSSLIMYVKIDKISLNHSVENVLNQYHT